jgi:hypothetical protein
VGGVRRRWFEVWADEGLDPPYLLLLRPVPDGFEVLDPIRGWEVAYRAATYDDARLWLVDDEYTQVGGRFVTL